MISISDIEIVPREEGYWQIVRLVV
jgi:hypothetical protein